MGTVVSPLRLLTSLLSLFILVSGQESSVEKTICVVASKASDGSYDFSLETDEMYFHRPEVKFLIPAAAWFNQSINDLGMAFQTIKTSAQFTDTIQAYWAGYLELYISRDMTAAHLENTFGGFCEEKEKSTHCEQLKRYIQRNLEMTIKRSVQSGDIDPYWHQMELILWQLRGIQDAWRNVTVTNSKTFTNDYLDGLLDDVFDIYLLQLNVDIGEVSAALGSFDELNKGPNGKLYFSQRSSCSALVKISPDRRDLFVSHNTWQGYEYMLKVMKYYDFDWHLTRDPNSPMIPSERILFSSYPSTINSVDDFYVCSTGLVTQETTNGNSNPELWPFVRHGFNTSVLEVFRVMIANRLARTPSEWISFFSRENSGTYNNQWMVVDTKKFNPSKPLPKNDLFWVAEQIPGFVQSADVTQHLIEKSYWGSYNNPYFEFIHKISGFDDLQKKHGDCFSYDKCARAQIFRRDHHKAVSLPTVYKLMRYNDYTRDPLSWCNCTPPYTGQFAIAARGDLNDPNGTYPLPLMGFRLHGATDVKLVNLALIKSLGMIAVAGPTYDQVPVFEWSRAWPDRPRPRMHPERWAFSPIVITVDQSHVGPTRAPGRLNTSPLLP